MRLHCSQCRRTTSLRKTQTLVGWRWVNKRCGPSRRQQNKWDNICAAMNTIIIAKRIFYSFYSMCSMLRVDFFLLLIVVHSMSIYVICVNLFEQYLCCVLRITWQMSDKKELITSSCFYPIGILTQWKMCAELRLRIHCFRCSSSNRMGHFDTWKCDTIALNWSVDMRHQNSAMFFPLFHRWI